MDLTPWLARWMRPHAWQYAVVVLVVSLGFGGNVEDL